MKKGLIADRKRRQQILRMNKIRFGGCTPTDIDMFMELGARIFIFTEVKYKDAPIPKGQRWAFEVLVDILCLFGHAVFVIVRHDKPVDKDVKVHKGYVDCYYTAGKWVKLNEYPRYGDWLARWKKQADNDRIKPGWMDLITALRKMS